MMKATENSGAGSAKHKGEKTAFVTDACTGCGGAPVCITFCQYGALISVPDNENYPFRKMKVDSQHCRACGSCILNGKLGVRLTGCPWDAIQIIRIFRKKGGV